MNLLVKLHCFLKKNKWPVNFFIGVIIHMPRVLDSDDDLEFSSKFIKDIETLKKKTGICIYELNYILNLKRESCLNQWICAGKVPRWVMWKASLAMPEYFERALYMDTEIVYKRYKETVKLHEVKRKLMIQRQINPLTQKRK